MSKETNKHKKNSMLSLYQVLLRVAASEGSAGVLASCLSGVECLKQIFAMPETGIEYKP